jgi:hypothetical protein
MAAYGGYAGHGETYLHPQDILWWSKGGVLRGESWSRIAFLRRILEAMPPGGLEPLADSWMWARVAGGQNGAYRLIYFGEHQPRRWSAGLPPDVRYTVDIIDTWAMTISTLPGVFENAAEIELPGKPFMAVRIQPVEEHRQLVRRSSDPDEGL